jgi:hypothetical protein
MQEVGGSIPPGSTNLRRFVSYGSGGRFARSRPKGRLFDFPRLGCMIAAKLG